jgi:hypothetical protein
MEKNSGGCNIFRKGKSSLKFQTSDAFLNLKITKHFKCPALQEGSAATGWYN